MWLVHSLQGSAPSGPLIFLQRHKHSQRLSKEVVRSHFHLPGNCSGQSLMPSSPPGWQRPVRPTSYPNVYPCSILVPLFSCHRWLDAKKLFAHLTPIHVCFLENPTITASWTSPPARSSGISESSHPNPTPYPHSRHLPLLTSRAPTPWLPTLQASACS